MKMDGETSMKVLWLINIPLPEASHLLHESSTPYGGWLVNTSKYLSNLDEVKLSVAFPSKQAKRVKRLEGDKIIYYPFSPIKKVSDPSIQDHQRFRAILQEVSPDLVHIFGTEMPHTLAMVNACRRQGVKTVVSIQGLVSVIEKHTFAGLPQDAIHNKTFRNWVRHDHVSGLRKTFQVRGEAEREAIRKVDHVIGRTTWDRACVSQINDQATYFHCNETLRESFYHETWEREKCEPHSIFLSQGQYSIKGLHFMLEAMPLILQRYPDARLYIGGSDLTDRSGLKNKLFATHYGNYIQSLIDQYNLSGHISFTGTLDEQAMCQRYLKSHVFVCPSTIENSPNSLAEAMLLGVPSVASYVGGTSDMLTDKKEGFLYQHDAPYMLAYYVCKVFEDDVLAKSLSAAAQQRAKVTHDQELNLQRLLEIYQDMLTP